MLFTEKEWAEFQTGKNNEEEIGKYVLCKARENGATRLFLHRFNTASTLVTKEGWWDTFTVSEKTCEKAGYYICKIVRFRVDRNGYMNMIVKPEKYLGETVDEDCIAWDYLFGTGLFSKQYAYSHAKIRFNVSALESAYAPASSDKKTDILKMFLADEISLKDMEKFLDSPTSVERLALDLHRHPESYKEQYPFLVKKMPKDDSIYSVDTLVGFLERKDLEYDSLTLGDETDLFSRVNEVCKFWDVLNEERKAQRRAKRRAEKKA